jgi:hypothetical protein
MAGFGLAAVRPLAVSRWLTCGVVWLGASAASAQAQSPKPDSTGTIVGIVTMRDGGLPLAYTVVSAPILARERFSNEQGVFVLTELPSGQLQLRVRHLGYTPVDLSVTVQPGKIDTLHVQLVHIAVRLSTVEVHAYPECKNPGVPTAASDSAFATVFDQLKQNAEQFRLLTGEYPFVYSVERMLSTASVNGAVHLETVDTTTFESVDGWKYRPGTIIQRSGGPRLFGSSTAIMHVPTLVHFADPVFLDNHCFYNGGVEVVDGTELLRIDFVAAARIGDADVNGSMYLDPVSFQIRRSVLRLSRIPRGFRGLTGMEAVTYFGELFPSVSVIAGISSVSRLQPSSRRPDALAESNEQQRLLRVHFLKGMPGDERKKP